MRRVFLTFPALLIVAGVYLAILLVLVRVTLMVGNISAGVIHTLAGCGELVLAVLLLLGGTVVATRTAVWIFGPADESDHA